ncbi:hypothetical protein COOONC_17850 [Cooperia oncophora]
MIKLSSTILWISRDNVPQDEIALNLFISAFASFVEKNIVNACESMKHVLSKSDADLTVLVYTFLKTMIDQPIASSLESDLKRKKNVCNRVVLFLKHMDVYDRVATTKILMSDQRNSRTGASILDEVRLALIIPPACFNN